MTRLLLVLTIAGVLGCGDDDKSPKSPTEPTHELVGNWVGVSSTNPEITDEAARSTTLVLRADGTQNTNIATGFGELTISLSGTWEIVGEKLVISIYAAGETVTTSDSYTIEGDRLTLVDDDDGYLDIWERQW